MNRGIKMLLLLACVVGLFSCTAPSPQKVVERTWVNTNQVLGHYSPRFFGELRELKSKDRITVVKDGTVTKGTAVEYLSQTVIGPLNERIKKVEALPESASTQALIAASLAVFRYGKAIFENEYLEIAGMIDEQRPEKEIDAAIESLFLKYDEGMKARVQYLDDQVIPYAEKHGIPIQTVNSRPRH